MMTSYHIRRANILAQAASDTESTVTRGRLKSDVLRAQLEQLEAVSKAAIERHRAQSERADALKAEYNARPERFSIVRGSLFMLFAGSALIGDVVFLGFVLADLLGVGVRDAATGLTFVQMIFLYPIEAFATFPDIAMLSFSVLSIGFLVKLWHDVEHEESGASRSWRWTVRIIMAGAVVTLICISGVRLYMEIPGIDNLFARFVTALLGVTLPLVSALFFVEGLDRLGRRFQLSRASFLAWLTRGAPEPTELVQRRKEWAEAQAENERLSSPQYGAAVAAQVIAQLEMDGASEMAALIQSPGGVFNWAKITTIRQLIVSTGR
jgi:hypothetical protein